MKHLRILGMILIIILLSSCLPGDGTSSGQVPAGFFWGIWHGWIAPVSLIISFFREDISIYEIHNKGFNYDIGFYLAILGGFGSFRLFRKRREGNSSKD